MVCCCSLCNSTAETVRQSLAGRCSFRLGRARLPLCTSRTANSSLSHHRITLPFAASPPSQPPSSLCSAVARTLTKVSDDADTQTQLGAAHTNALLATERSLSFLQPPHFLPDTFRWSIRRHLTISSITSHRKCRQRLLPSSLNTSSYLESYLPPLQSIVTSHLDAFSESALTDII